MLRLQASPRQRRIRKLEAAAPHPSAVLIEEKVVATRLRKTGSGTPRE